MDPTEEEEKPKTQSEMFEEERHKSFFGHLEGEDEEPKEDESKKDGEEK